MNLTAKFLVAFASISLAAVAENGYVRVLRETDLFDTDMRRDAAAYAASLARGTGTVAELSGDGEAKFLIGEANASSPHLKARWVSVDGESGPRLEPPLLPLAELEPVRGGRILSANLEAKAGEPAGVVTYAPLPLDGPLSGTAIEVFESTQDKQQFVSGTIQRTVLFSFNVLALTSLVAWGLGYTFITRPIRQLLGKARRISGGDLSGPLVLRQRDELRVLAEELNAMCERLASARAQIENETSARISALEQMRHADRLATVGRLASGIAHEIGTPLAVAGGRAHMIASREVLGEEAVSNARTVEEQVQRISAIIRQLLDFARRRPAQKGPVDLRGLAERAVLLLQSAAAKRQLKLGVGAGDPVLVQGDAGQLEQALTNLVMNAIHATAGGGSVEVSFRRETAQPPPDHGGSEGEFAVLSVADTGCGMDAATLEHIFEPFFTTKDIGEGTGLGLPVSYGIAREHGGWIEVESEPGKGSRFAIHLPLDERETAPPRDDRVASAALSP